MKQYAMQAYKFPIIIFRRAKEVYFRSRKEQADCFPYPDKGCSFLVVTTIYKLQCLHGKITHAQDEIALDPIQIGKIAPALHEEVKVLYHLFAIVHLLHTNVLTLTNICKARRG